MISKSYTAGSIAATAPVSQPVATEAAAAPAGATTEPQSATTAAAAATTNAALSTDGDQAGTKFVVNSLTRGSDVVTLKFSLVNGSAAPLPTYGKFRGVDYAGSSRDMSGIHLIDTVSKKKYFPLADTEHMCLCSRDVEDIAPNSQASLWVKFPAPPAAVTKITVEVPHFIPLDNVPITQ